MTVLADKPGKNVATSGVEINSDQSEIINKFAAKPALEHLVSEAKKESEPEMVEGIQHPQAPLIDVNNKFSGTSSFARLFKEAKKESKPEIVEGINPRQAPHCRGGHDRGCHDRSAHSRCHDRGGAHCRR